ncbi:MAG: Rieske 2Fe-2S domain-containing protein [Acidobacteriia bacterium]|nr:Rieske 2Fe-2S domain-containing protein [Terriglobia bacterium]
MTGQVTEVEHAGPVEGLVGRILRGEIFVLRGGLQRLGLFDALVQASLEGIGRAAGDDIARKVEQGGFERVHEWVEPADIPALTDAVYRIMVPLAHGCIRRFASIFFPDSGSYYYERNPNVRFHIPYDLAEAHRQQFDRFARQRGEGKISAHGPHRDAWVDCPSNAINVWIAMGPVQPGNGLSIFAKEYHNSFAFKDGYLSSRAALHRPLNFSLQPGDILVFHGNHLHASELNQTGATRYVISYRITFGKPHYAHGHYHHYLHAGLAESRWSWLAGLPQNLQRSFFSYQIRRLLNKISVRRGMSGADNPAAATPYKNESKTEDLPGDDDSIALAGFPVGAIRAISKGACLARLGENEFAAVSRRCPHRGGDLAEGWLADGKLVCPLHNLAFDPQTGASPCTSLKPLRRFAWEVRGDRVFAGPQPLS